LRELLQIIRTFYILVLRPQYRDKVPMGST